ncbi:MAG: hypothetical protein ACM309_00795 [Bacillota bacterium]
MGRTDIDAATEITIAWLNALAASGQGNIQSRLGLDADKQAETVCKFFKAVKKATYEVSPDESPMRSVRK